MGWRYDYHAMKVRPVFQPALCDACGRLLVPKEDHVLYWQSRKTGKRDVLLCAQCVQLGVDLFLSWHVESQLPERS